MGETIVVGSCNGFIYGVDKGTGKARWKYEARADGGSPEFHAAPLVLNDLVIIGSDDRRPEGIGYVYAIEAANGAVRWKTRIGRGSMTDVAPLAGRLYTVTLDNELVALDVATGKLEWSFRGAEPAESEFANVLATPAVSTELVYFGGADGVLYALAPDSGALAWKTEIGSRIVTPLVLVSDSLYLATLDRRVLRAESAHGKVMAELKLGQVAFGPGHSRRAVAARLFRGGRDPRPERARHLSVEGHPP